MTESIPSSIHPNHAAQNPLIWWRFSLDFGWKSVRVDIGTLILFFHLLLLTLQPLLKIFKSLLCILLHVVKPGLAWLSDNQVRSPPSGKLHVTFVNPQCEFLQIWSMRLRRVETPGVFLHCVPRAKAAAIPTRHRQRHRGILWALLPSGSHQLEDAPPR